MGPDRILNLDRPSGGGEFATIRLQTAVRMFRTAFEFDSTEDVKLVASGSKRPGT